MLRITVGDTGRGIKAEDQKRIFDPFFSTKLQGKGAGLGLTLAHSIVHAHGGRLLVESAFGKGSTFTIELPLLPCKVEAEAAAPVVPSVAVGTGHRLLVVDDEPGMIDVLTEVFTDKGYIVDFALGGTDGMKCVLAEPYDLVMLDLDMPDMDGEAFYKALRTTEPDMARRIVFMTGDTTSPSVRSFLTGTGNRWLPKPFDIADALQVVENVLRQKTESTTTEKQN
jgi:CheY-like chemotaxis protein